MTTTEEMAMVSPANETARAIDHSRSLEKKDPLASAMWSVAAALWREMELDELAAETWGEGPEGVLLHRAKVDSEEGALAKTIAEKELRDRGKIDEETAAALERRVDALLADSAERTES